MKKILSLLVLLVAFATTQAQNPFFEVVNYRGAFAPAPTTPWTDGWVSWDPQHSTPYSSTEDSAARTLVVVTDSIRTNTTWTSNKVYKISGLIYVTNGATLTIQPGTLIQGNAAVTNSSLVITRGSKINAVGTSSNPIVFTSSKDTGLRAKGDWGGIIILGKSTLNKSGGVANIEGIATSNVTEFGGGTNPDDNDNSGNLKYVRIEYGGYVFATDKEINGLTLGAVGRNTVIDYVQCSYINDDAFEWFGGTVNCSHLVAYKCLDDNFDTDNGFSGSVQFGLGVRDPLISDQSSSSTSEGFESDNDACGTNNSPKTSAIFSNITDISGFFGLDSAARVAAITNTTFKFSVGARIRRNSNLKLFNSIMMDAPYGVRIDDAINTKASDGCSSPGFNFPVSANLQTGVTKYKNNIVAGNIQATYPGTRVAVRDSLFNQFGNDSLRNTTGILTSPYDTLSPDFRPATGSLALSNVNFTDAAFDGRKIIITNRSFIKEVSYRGAFAPAPSVMWTDTWTNWDPKHATYPSATDTVRGNITANTTWTSNKTYCLSGLVYVQNGVTLTIQPGTVILGDYATPNSSLVITKGGKLNAIGTVDSPIVFTSGKDTATRAKGDWGGIILLGRASLNRSGGVNNIEGIATSTATEFGGGASPNDNDNSGTLKYVRIEFGGYIFATDKEINGLTMGAVGRGTTIDYVQCSYINDDAFEWFGGTVNCSHLVAFKCLDDNFDTDNGFSGSVQFALGVRDSLISDQSSSSTSEGFESDNDACGTSNAPKTSALFSNITDISGFLGQDSANRVRLSSVPTFKFNVGARIRRNSNLKIFNSILMDAPWGVRIDDAVNTKASDGCSSPGFNFPVSANLQTGVTKFKNNLVAGNLFATYPGARRGTIDSLFGTGTGLFKNDSLRNTTNVLVNPYNTLAPDFRPGTNPLATTGFSFTDSAFNGLIALCDDVNAAGFISGASNVSGCTNPQTYSIPAIANASYYTWTVTGGATIASGQGTRTITVNFPATATYTGVITVVGKNDCGNTSAGSTKSITKVTLGTPGTISGPAAYLTNVCSLVAKDTAITYTIAAVAGATNYAWTAPTNTTIVTGQGTNTITVKFLNGFTTATAGDTLRVVVSSSCSTAVQKKLAIKAALPAAPTAITIGAIQTNICAARKYRYSVPVSTASGFTGYSWSFQGPLYSTMTIDSGSLTSRVLTVTFTSNDAATTADSIKCFYTSSCGNTVAKGAKLSNTKLAAPAVPTFTITSVAQNVCNARQYRYSAPALPLASTTAGAASAWNWELVGALAEYASIDSGDNNSQKILVTFTSNAAAATGDSIKLFYSTNGCGNSLTKATKMSNTKLSAPAAPTAITITAIQTNVCGERKYRYSAPALPAASTTAGVATGYVWELKGTLGLNATIDSGSLTSRTFTATYTSNAASATGDSVKVYFTSDCGNTAAKASKLSNTALGKPAAPTVLTIQLKSDVCGARTYRYITTNNLPTATTTAGAATGYDWSFVGNLGANATIDSGDATSKVITATFTSNVAAATGDSVKLAFISGCGNSAFKATKLSNLAKVCLTSGTEITSRVEATNKAQVYPNPNNGNFTLNVATGVTAKATATVQIVDMLGKVVMTTMATNNNGSIVANINNSNLQNGVYTVKYTVGNVTNSIKMVVKK
jgi:peroxiredoxin family protein